MKKRLAVIALVFILIVSAAVPALATATKPWKKIGCHFEPSGASISYGRAYTDKCDCNPVQNKLGARVKIQSNKDWKFVNSAWSSWVTKENTSTAYAEALAASGYRVNCAYGEHKGICGKGKTVSDTSKAIRN